MIVYHWTSRQNANKILKYGLFIWSFVCREPSDWNGEICLEIILQQDIDWDSRDEDAKWQAIVHETILPERIHIYNHPNEEYQARRGNSKIIGETNND